MADEFQEAGLFHKGAVREHTGTIGTGSHDADVDEGTKGDGTRWTSVVGDGRCERRLQQRVGPGSVGCGGGVGG